jgi:hypothetical protein
MMHGVFDIKPQHLLSAYCLLQRPSRKTRYEVENSTAPKGNFRKLRSMVSNMLFPTDGMFIDLSNRIFASWTATRLGYPEGTGSSSGEQFGS